MKSKSNDKAATPDFLWKELIRNFFKDFVAFIKPELLPQIIIEKTEFLEQEVRKITARQKKGIVDVLAKIFLKNGSVEYILFHIEVQGYRETDFQERMFTYFLRIWDKFHKPVLSLAILTYPMDDSNVENRLEIKSFGTVLRFEYNVFLTQHLNYATCLASNNCVEVALGILAPTPALPLWRRKADVLKKLIGLGYQPEQAHLLISFVDRHSPLSASAMKQFEKYVAEHEEEVYMIMTSFEERGIERGIEKGIERGIEKGIEKGIERGIEKGRQEGIEEGVEQGKLDSLNNILKVRFGMIPETWPEALKKIKSGNKLDELIRLAVQVESLEKMLLEIKKIKTN